MGGPSLAAFEVDVGAARGGSAPNGSDGTDDGCRDSIAARGTDGAAAGASIWLAGNVEAFNIPGTNYIQPTGLRFLPSCYQWQHLAHTHDDAARG